MHLKPVSDFRLYVGVFVVTSLQARLARPLKGVAEASVLLDYLWCSACAAPSSSTIPKLDIVHEAPLRNPHSRRENSSKSGLRSSTRSFSFLARKRHNSHYLYFGIRSTLAMTRLVGYRFSMARTTFIASGMYSVGRLCFREAYQDLS